MLNFRFHIVSLVAVFLALAIGIIMGSTVIDRALVDTLEDQQQSLREDLNSLADENAALRSELDEMRESSDRLASEGGERLLAGTLAETPVLVIAVRGVDSSVVDELGELLGIAGADDQGVLWLTDRFELADEASTADLAGVLGRPTSTPPAELQQEAFDRIAGAVRAAVTPQEGADAGGGAEEETTTEAGADETTAPDGPTTTAAVDTGGATTTSIDEAEGKAAVLDDLVALRETGFIEYDAPGGGLDDVTDLAAPGTRVVLVSGSGAAVADGELAAPLARALVSQVAPGEPVVPLLAAEASPSADEVEDGDGPVPFVGLLREGDVADRLSTVDNLDTFAGRLAAVVALQDLGEGRRGHYGVGPGAQRLVPAPEG